MLKTAGGRRSLDGLHILVVEDDYMVASAFAFALEEHGVQVAGPVGSVREAMDILCSIADLDGAFLDINLGDEQVFPVAAALVTRGTPFVFVTGYDASVLTPEFANFPRCEKPVSIAVVAQALIERMDAMSAPCFADASEIPHCAVV